MCVGACVCVWGRVYVCGGVCVCVCGGVCMRVGHANVCGCVSTSVSSSKGLVSFYLNTCI